MAGTMPHAIFIETGLNDGAVVAAYAAELPGCATFAPSADEAAAAMPRRVLRFTAWLAALGEETPEFVGDNWYEVERAAAGAGPGDRAAFSLDELPPSDEEWARWLRWLELAREELAAALDEGDAAAAPAITRRIAGQDDAFTRALSGRTGAAVNSDSIDRLYAARDALTDALEAGGPSTDGVRRILRLAIADDLHAAGQLRGEGA